MFDVRDRLHELRCRETESLHAMRAERIRVQREARVDELLITRVLDERGALDEATAAGDGISERSLRETVRTARALESLPRIAAAAHAGRLSDAQLGPVTKLADEASDGEWAARAPHTPPVELSRLARCQRKPAPADAQARRRARRLSMTWDDAKGMLHLRGALADIDGARFEATINRLAEQMQPAKGEPWDSFEHRAADALVQLCEPRACTPDEGPSLADKPLLVTQVPLHGPAMVGGVALPDTMLEQLRANAVIEPVLVGEHGEILAVGARRPGLSPKRARAILLRDGHCRCGTCEVRHGLEIHHLVPRSWGGSDDPSNLAVVCRGSRGHHPMLIPHGPFALVGNPNLPDGLRLVRYDQLSPDEATHYGLPPPPGPSP